MKSKKAFTLIEVLISIVLVGLILPPLYKLISLMNDSNNQIYKYVKKQNTQTDIIDTLYLDILSSDGNISVNKDDFDRLCIRHTKNSLYGKPLSQVCWAVLKSNNRLVRIEGKEFKLPLELNDQVHIDSTLSHLEIFDIYRTSSDILVILKQKHQAPITFAIYDIHKPKKKKKIKKKNKA
jgi:prepilin-type N-terminal cleavage/methylation domain-containing protein